MRHARLVPAVSLLIALALAEVAAAQELPRVRLVATGGTISNRAGGRLTADDLLGLIPDVRRVARPEAEQFSNVSSSELTLAQWLALSRRLNELYATEKDLAGIVVTSGTDTLEELAYFLHLTVRDARPVVVMGSMRNAEHGRVRGTRRTCSRRSGWRPRRTRAGRACSWSSTTRSTPRAR